MEYYSKHEEVPKTSQTVQIILDDGRVLYYDIYSESNYSMACGQEKPWYYVGPLESYISLLNTLNFIQIKGSIYSTSKIKEVIPIGKEIEHKSVE